MAVGGLIKSIFGSGNSQTTQGNTTGSTSGKIGTQTGTKGTTVNTGTTVNKGIDVNKGLSTTGSKGTTTSQSGTRGSTTGSTDTSSTNLGASHTQGSTTGTSNTAGSTTGTTNTKGTANQATTQTATSGGTQTTVGTADIGALATAKGLTATALANSTNDKAIQGLISNTLQKSAIAFAPQGNAGRDSGLYSGSSEQLLTGYAQGQAVADATASVLDYKTQQQQIAGAATDSVLQATKGTTGTTVNTSTGVSNTANTSNQTQNQAGTSNQTDNTTGTSDQTNKTADTSNQTQATAGTSDQQQNTVGTSNQTQATDSINTQKNNNISNTDSQTAINNLVNGLTQSKGNSTGTTTANQSGNQGGVFSSLSLVCAEMLRQGKMELRLWVMINRHFIESVGPLGKIGYWTWAGPVAWFARRNPEHWFTGIMFWLTEERACYVAAKFLGRGPRYEITLKGMFAYWLIFCFSYLIAYVTWPARIIYTAYWARNIKRNGAISND